MVKRIWALLLCVVMSISLSACAENNLDRMYIEEAQLTEEEKNTSFAQGIELVYKQLMTALEGMGVTVIEAVGVEFNPDFHNAVMQAPSEEYESGIITQELQRGYLYKDKVVRHSMVMVAE